MVAALVIAGRRTWRQFWFSVEDPRAMGLFRIVFALVAICNVNGLAEYFMFLFSDEGILPASVARKTFAAAQFVGYGEGVAGEPSGFFDLSGFVRFISGPKFSVLLFWDCPAAVWANVALFEISGLLLLIGWRTRTAAAVGLIAMVSLFDRNPLFWEGTDIVIRVFFIYLVCARCGHAYSVDNWLRCRRLTKHGRLSPHGSEPMYRPIPVWPRRLMMLQIATIYFTTGTLKSGAVWANGDAIFYALNLDHFWRVPPQAMTAVLGTNVLRVATWFVRFGEIAFALAFLGAVLRVHDEQPSGAPKHPRIAAVVPWFRVWVFGRRIWITWAAVTMGGVFVLMNLGQFQPAMLALCVVYFRGEEIEAVVARVCRRTPRPTADRSQPQLQRPSDLLPAWALAVTAAAGLGAFGMAMAGRTATPIAGAAVAFVMGVYVYRRVHRHTRRLPARQAWAYGSLGRIILGLGLAWHIGAVGVWLIPKGDATDALRKHARAWVEPWIVTTRMSQGWGMFAPNPPRNNVFMQVLVTDTDGEVWDMQSDVYAASRRPVPFIWNDRMRKMNRRMIGEQSGGGSWYRKWYARWQCRDFALRHGGRVPERVELVLLSYRIPTPEQMAAHGWYRPSERLAKHGKRKVMETQTCRHTQDRWPTIGRA